MTQPEDVLDFWFGDAHGIDPRWFRGGESFDDEIRERFGEEVEAALDGGFDDWESTARHRLALILLLDQFTRNLFRSTPRMYAGDERAFRLSRWGIEQGMDLELVPRERAFFYLPLEHAEDLDAQLVSVERFERLATDAGEDKAEMAAGFLDYAKRHAEVVRRFGRFPHRNVIFGRETTAEERAFLDSDAAPF